MMMLCASMVLVLYLLLLILIERQFCNVILFLSLFFNFSADFCPVSCYLFEQAFLMILSSASISPSMLFLCDFSFIPVLLYACCVVIFIYVFSCLLNYILSLIIFLRVSLADCMIVSCLCSLFLMHDARCLNL